MDRLELLKEVGEEIITEDELKELLKKKSFLAYDGFEPSGNIHIAQGLLRAINIQKIIKAGGKFKMLVADWHAAANNKLGGDLEKIKVTGEYFIETWKACGLDTKDVEFIWASDLVKDDKYWELVLKVSMLNTVKRITRCSQIMGRSESESLSASQILYPCMQAADIFYLNVDVAQLGMDQRKVNMLAREIAPKLNKKKPIIISHHMLMGLGLPPASDLKGADRGIELKMSKSKPDSAIFMQDDEKTIQKKMNKAFCPEKQIEDNPILEYMKYIIFERFDSIKIERPDKFGGTLEFKSYQELKDSFAKGDIHPADLKQTASKYINELIKPIRDHFEKNSKAKKLLEKVKSFEITR